MPRKSQPPHLRLPQQSSKVIGAKPPLGEPEHAKAGLDSRTVTQDPVLQPGSGGRKPAGKKAKR